MAFPLAFPKIASATVLVALLVLVPGVMTVHPPLLLPNSTSAMAPGDDASSFLLRGATNTMGCGEDWKCDGKKEGDACATVNIGIEYVLTCTCKKSGSFFNKRLACVW
ncbi:unnamed protein product [Vitrella brassicaformis CCMP3155]|uniref:EGF-like domain-containing protein n=1 Tax=Vitrella brassicaformis (strain CCMP3155) TaxID=1169540 RepID=A0A0G4ERW6_VITBC|nr:unnamed protein product [Vitrella brassicaformis CCMP3155]|eukprot:CEL99978.1 unnamed protein product [Vitrella brassicaformis CCMP3155]